MRRFLGAVLIIVVIFSIPFILRMGTGDPDRVPPGTSQIAVATLRGMIATDSTGTGAGGVEPLVSYLERVRERDSIKAVVLRVDSGGGTASASQEVHRALMKIREAGKPVVVSMGDVAASGGYYVAVAADKILANPSTTTGSIGVIVQYFNFAEFAETHGFTFETIASGPNKAAGDPTKRLTDEQRAALAELVDDAYDQFVEAVAEGRGLPKEEVLQIADGRILTGRQALQLNLIDEFGGLEEAIELAATLAGIEGQPAITRPQLPREPLFTRLLRLSSNSGGIMERLLNNLVVESVQGGMQPVIYY